MTPITLTPSAIGRLKALQPKYIETPIFRLVVQSGGCNGFQYTFGFVATGEPDDICFSIEGIPIAIDAVAAPFIEGTVLDYVESMIGSSFNLSNPNAVSSCGCGSSFSVNI